MKPYIFGLAILSILIPFTSVIASASSSCVILPADLRQNAATADVAALQNFLIGQNYLKAKATGYFGPATLRAVQAFQKANGLNAAGFVGPQTRAKISLLSCTPSANSGTPAATPPVISTVPAKKTVSSTTPDGPSTGTNTTSTNAAASGGNVVSAPPLYPDPKAAYLQIRSAYDAAQTLDAFIAVSQKYASVARQSDVAAQKIDMQSLSPAEKDDYLSSNIKSVIPNVGEIASVGVLQNGGTATLIILPSAASGKTVKGLVVLVFENGAWKLQSEKWQDNAGNGIEPLPSANGG